MSLKLNVEQLKQFWLSLVNSQQGENNQSAWLILESY